MSNQATSATRQVTGKVRLSYAHIWTPKAIAEGQEPKYSVCILIPKTDKATIGKIRTAVEAAKAAGVKLWGGKVPAGLKLPTRDGDSERPDEEAYAGCYFINANSLQKPGIVDQNLNPILDTTEVYSGCYCRVSLNFFPYNQAGNKGVGCGLGNIQKIADGESLGGRSRPEDDFDPIAFEDNDEDDGILG